MTARPTWEGLVDHGGAYTHSAEAGMTAKLPGASQVEALAENDCWLHFGNCDFEGEVTNIVKNKEIRILNSAHPRASRRLRLADPNQMTCTSFCSQRVPLHLATSHLYPHHHRG